ncbi:hypothetical protein [Janthinobacterium sp. RB2P8]|uniref:hypothetical protein n=1 Tax=Janthinobacterium sp. RB2P8 TaxID=3424191 RepID=UPI003F263922
MMTLCRPPFEMAAGPRPLPLKPIAGTSPCVQSVFTYRIYAGATMLSQAAFDDFLLCVLTARQMKREYLSKHLEGVLRVEIIYPHGARVPSADLAAAEAALAAPAPGTEFGCPIRESIGQLVESRRSSAPPIFMVVDAPGTATRQSSNVHAVAGAGEFCRVSAMGGPVRQNTLISRELAA